MSTPGELACIYACLILHDDGIPITAEKITTLAKTANVEVESYWPGLFAKLVEKRNIDDLITNIGSSGGGVAAPVAVASASASAAPAAEEKKKEEVVEESDEDMDFTNIFDEE